MRWLLSLTSSASHAAPQATYIFSSSRSLAPSSPVLVYIMYKTCSIEFQSWDFDRQSHALNSMVLQKLFHDPWSVRTGIIILENENAPSIFRVRHHDSFMDVISVPHFFHCSFWDHVKPRTGTIVDATSHYDAASPIMFDFCNEGFGKSLSFSAPDSHTSVIVVNLE